MTRPGYDAYGLELFPGNFHNLHLGGSLCDLGREYRLELERTAATIAAEHAAAAEAARIRATAHVLTWHKASESKPIPRAVCLARGDSYDSGYMDGYMLVRYRKGHWPVDLTATQEEWYIGKQEEEARDVTEWAYIGGEDENGKPISR